MTTATLPIEVLAARTDGYIRFVQRHFFRTLNREDCANAVQDAFLDALASDVCAGLDEAQLEAWLKTAAYKKALDIVRKREGRGAQRRTATDIDALAEVLPDASSILEEDTTDDDAQAVLAAFQRLPALQQRIIGLRHLDNLPREACAQILGLPVAKYKRAHTEAVKRLISLVVETRPHDSCLEARSLIDLSVADLLDHHTAARRDAHMAGCAHCRQYQRRSRGLLVFLPLPAIGLGDRLLARMHAVLERVVPAVQTADTATTAGGAGALSAGAAKLTALVATGAIAIGGGTAIVHQASPASQRQTKPAAAAIVGTKPVAAAVTPPTVTNGTQRSYTAPAAPTTSNSNDRHKSDKTASQASGELKPRGNEIAAARPPTSVAPVAAHTASTTSPKPMKSAPVAVSTPAPADSFSGEFAPHP